MKKNLFLVTAVSLMALTACKKTAQPQQTSGDNTHGTELVEQEELAGDYAEDSSVQMFLDLEEPDTDGRMHKLSEYVGKGQWVLIDFWASWCGPCRAEMPNVVAAYRKYHSKGFNIVGLSFDQDKDSWLQAIDELDMPWVHLSDLKGWDSKAAEIYGVNSIPASLLVDPAGKIVAANLRGEALGETLQRIFGEE